MTHSTQHSVPGSSGSFPADMLLQVRSDGGAEPQAVPERELLYLTGRLLGRDPQGVAAGRAHQASLALMGAMLRAVSSGDVPPSLARQVPPAARDLDVANALGASAEDAADRFDLLLDRIAEAMPPNRPGTMRALMQAQTEVLRLQTVECGAAAGTPPAPDAAGADVVEPNEAAWRAWTLLRWFDTRAAAAVPAPARRALHAIACGVLTLAARMGAPHRAPALRAAAVRLTGRIADVLGRQVALRDAAGAVAAGLVDLMQTMQSKEGQDEGQPGDEPGWNCTGTAWGCLHALFCLQQDMRALDAALASCPADAPDAG